MKIPSSNLRRTCCVQKLFLTFRAIFVRNMFSPCKKKSFWQRFTCIISMFSKDSALCSSKYNGATLMICEWLCTACNSNLSCCSSFVDLLIPRVSSITWAVIVGMLIGTFIGWTDALEDIFLIAIFTRQKIVIQQQVIIINQERLIKN